MRLKLLLVPFVLFVLGCGVVTQSIAPTNVSTETSQSPATMAASDTPIATAMQTVEVSSTPAPTLPALPFVTPGSTAVSLPPMFGNLNNISQYYNPSGAPAKNWNDIPIMPQATAGQDWNNGVYSYKADAALSQAIAFYSKFTPSGSIPMPPATGFGGTGSDATHDATFLYPNAIIQITSYDNNPSQVIVVISAQK